MNAGTPFVAREHELRRLYKFIDQANQGKGGICFVTGEAGTGKTALVTEFSRRSQNDFNDMVVVYGQCNALTGVGDPYLPFREILQQLTGDVKAELEQGTMNQENANRLRYLLSMSGRALVEVGPDLIGLFVPGAGLLARLAAFAFDESEPGKRLRRLVDRQYQRFPITHLEIKPHQIFEQYTNTLLQLSKQVIIVLILEDLHWIDSASAELLFHLSRKIDRSRLLIVGTYRPAEIEIGRRIPTTGQIEQHPLNPLLSEIKRYGEGRDMFIDLEQTRVAERRRFINAFLNTEPNKLGKKFRRELLDHTDGHPLFTIELLREMQAQGDLVKDAQGRWMEGSVLNWDKFPARVEGVVEARINRLGRNLRRLLTIGSVEGEIFTAQVIARIQSHDIQNLIDMLGDVLERRHKLVQFQSEHQLNGQWLSFYRFRHNLFQIYLYSKLDGPQRRHLHEDIGNVLEVLYGDQSDEIAVELARHFEEAGIQEKACHYLWIAGQQAATRFANRQALDYYDRALSLASKADLEARYKLQLAREKVIGLQGKRQQQAEVIFKLENLARKLDNQDNTTWRQAEVALRQSWRAELMGDYPTSAAKAQMAVTLLNKVPVLDSDFGSPPPADLEALAYHQWGASLSQQGLLKEATQKLIQAQTKSGGKPQLEGLVQNTLGNVSLTSGDFNKAEKLFNLALDNYRSIGYLHGEAKVLHNLGSVYFNKVEFEKDRLVSEKALELYRQVGDRRGEGAILSNLGIIDHVHGGNYPEAIRWYEQALQIAREVGDRDTEASLLNNLGSAAEEQGEYLQAGEFYQDCLEIWRQNGDAEGEGMALCNLGILSQHEGDYDRANEYYDQALTTYREIGAKRGIGLVLSKMGSTAIAQCESAEAKDLYAEALQIASQIDHLRLKGEVLIGMGNTLLMLNQLEKATDFFQEAQELRKQSGQDHLVMESLDGLARISLQRGDLESAFKSIEPILDFIEESSLDGTDEPLRIYFTCFQVLQGRKDPRAFDILETAYKQLCDQANNILKDEVREAFLECPPWHKRILEEYKCLKRDANSL